MAKALKVKSKKNGYRRAGFGFSDTEDKTLLLGDLTKEQIAALKEDKNLLVVEAEVKDAKAKADEDDTTGKGGGGKKPDDDTNKTGDGKKPDDDGKGNGGGAKK